MTPQPESQNTELISAVAVLSTNVASLTKAVEITQQLLHGEGIEGGLLARVKEDHRILQDPETGLAVQVLHLAENCNVVLSAVKTQAESLKKVQRIVNVLLGVTIFLIATIGIADFKTVVSILLGLI